MNSRINYFELSSDFSKKLLDLSQYTKANSAIDRSILELCVLRASQINGCGFCIDMHVKEARIHGERELRLYHVSLWRESSLFNEKERAAFEWTEALTKLSEHGVSDDTYQKVNKVLSDKEISDLTFSIGVINFWNRLNVAFRTTPGSLDQMLGLTKANLI